MKCVKCEMELPAQAKFCHNCGTKIQYSVEERVKQIEDKIQSLTRLLSEQQNKKCACTHHKNFLADENQTVTVLQSDDVFSKRTKNGNPVLLAVLKAIQEGCRNEQQVAQKCNMPLTRKVRQSIIMNASHLRISGKIRPEQWEWKTISKGLKRERPLDAHLFVTGKSMRKKRRETMPRVHRPELIALRKSVATRAGVLVKQGMDFSRALSQAWREAKEDRQFQKQPTPLPDIIRSEWVSGGDVRNMNKILMDMLRNISVSGERLRFNRDAQTIGILNKDHWTDMLSRLLMKHKEVHSYLCLMNGKRVRIDWDDKSVSVN